MYAQAISPKLYDFVSYVAEAFEMSIRPDYSGRGMFGSHCFGLVFSGNAGQFFSAFLQTLEDEDIELKQELADLFDEMQTDSMGWDTIYYFPGWILEEETEEYEDEDEIEDEE